uniref:Structural polyprotein n=1 Tax=Bat cripavirus TaxID=1958779 RepID=A0A1S5VYU0_9VIRU|nr:structural polyprotein [Bat cripavirus]
MPLQDTMQHTDAMMHSVISFLKRPQLVHSFMFASDQARPTDLLNNGAPFLVPQTMFSPMLRAKLDGFTSFRATAVFKLQVNAQPFQCGRLLMAAIPMPGLLGVRKDWILKTTTTTQCVNHVQMDIAKQTEVELRVPFVSPFNSYNLINGNYDWAQLVVQVYSPLRQGGDQQQVQCLLWGHFEDIVLGAPTSATMFELPAKQQSAPREQKPGLVNVARAKEATTSLSPLAASIKGAGNNFIKSGSKVVNGVTDALAGIAGMFGWSKPIPNIPGMSVVLRSQENFTNCDYMDHSHSLSLCKLANVDNYNGLVGSNLDEMSFDFIKKIPQYVGNFQFTNSDAYGASLWQSAVAPTYPTPWSYSLKPAGATELTAFKQPTCLTYAIAPFAYWTGSLVYTFRFVKTDFHSGRVEISFHPFRSKNINITDGRHSYVYRVILDLRENSEASVTIPYISQQPWKKIAVSYDPYKEVDFDANLAIATGMIQVRALTPLMVSNAVASSNIECLIEVRAGDDFQVQCPTSSPFYPYDILDEVTAKQQSGQVIIQIEPPTPKQQSGSTHSLVFSNYAGGTNPKQITGLQPSELTKMVYEIQYVTQQKGFAKPDAARSDLIELQIDGLDQAFYLRYNQFWGGGDGAWRSNGVAIINSIGNATLTCTVTNLNSTPNIYYWINFNYSLIPVSETSPPVIPNPLPVMVKNEVDVSVVQSKGNNRAVLVDVGHAPETPLNVRVIETPNNPIDVNITQSIPLTLTIGDSVLPVDIRNQPIEVKGGGGGGPGGSVTIDPDSLPLWVTPYGPDATQQSGAMVVPGTAETRTRAIEGYTPPSITGSDSDINRADVSRYTSGEVFNSFRQLTRRFTWCLVNDIPALKNFRGRITGLIRPPTLCTGKIPTYDGQYVLWDTSTESQVIPSSLSYVAGMYAFYRGGMRVKTFIHPMATSAYSLMSMAYRYLNNAGPNDQKDNYQSSFEPVGFELPGKAIGEFQLPYYSPCLLSVPWVHELESSQFDQPQMEYTLSTTNHSRPEKFCLAVAGADDFDCQMFIGPPPVFLNDIHTIMTVGTTAVRIINAPEYNYSPTQIYIKSPQTAGQVDPTTVIPVSLSAFTITDLRPAPKPKGQVTFLSPEIQRQRDALADVREELAGSRTKRALTRQDAMYDLPLHFTRSEEIHLSHDSDDEVDFSSIARRDRGRVGI